MTLTFRRPLHLLCITSMALALACNAYANLLTTPIPPLHSEAFAIVDPDSGILLAERHSDRVMPIASITKLMTALVVLDSKQRLNDVLTVTNADIDHLKKTGSRLAIGARLSRAEMLHIALMASENRAASALARYYPGGTRAFVEAMNAKARMLGMWNSRFTDSTGLSPKNVSTARDLAKLVAAASAYPMIRQFSADDQYQVQLQKHQLHYRNSNPLVHEQWPISLSKTGYIREAGRCLVMQTNVNQQPFIIVLLNADTSSERLADAKHLKTWLTQKTPHTLTARTK